MIYTLPFFISLLSTIVNFWGYKSLSKQLVITTAFILILIAGLRYDTGFDFWNYEIMYNDAKIYNFYSISGCEPLFGIIYKLFSNINFEAFIFFIAFISISLKLKSILKYSFLPGLTIFIFVSKYFVLEEMGQIRQGIAIGFIFLSIKYILDRKLIKFSLLIFIATMLHSAAILFFIAYFLYNLNLRIISYILIVVFSLSFIFVDITFLISKIYVFLPSMLQEKFLFYTNVHIVKSEFYIKTIFLKFPVFIVGLFFYKKLKNNKLHLLFFNLYFIGIVTSLVFISFYQLCIRGSLYFSIFEIFLIPIFIYYLRHRLVNIFIYLLIIFYSVFSFSKIYTTDWSRFLLPYYSIFEKEKLSYKRSQAEFNN